MTPPEVVANLSAMFLDGSEDFLLASEQDENTDEVYDLSDWDRDFLLLRRLTLYARTKTTTTGERTVTLTLSGGLVRRVTV